MDKYEYRVRAEQIKTLLENKEYAEAMNVADTVDWRRVKSVSMLCTVSEIYKINRKYEESRDILLLAYERYPEGRMIVYALCELAIKMEEYVQAVEYLKEFVQIAPRDTGVYILRYKLYEAQDVPLEERIEVLEEFKERDYRERWAYELAYLYHRIGLGTKCVEECDEIILWFGEGKYVIKAMELKMLHEPLTEEQRIKYEERNLRHEQPQAMEYVDRRPMEPVSQESMDAMRAAERKMATEHTGNLSQLFGDIPVDQAEQSQVINDDEIEVKPMNMSRFSTINLQEELAKSMQEFLTTEGASGEVDYAAQPEQYMQPEQMPPQYEQPQEQYMQPEPMQPQYEQPQEQYVQPEPMQPQYEQPQEQYVQPEPISPQYEQPEEQYVQPEPISPQPETTGNQELPDVEELIARRDKLIQEMQERQEEKDRQAQPIMQQQAKVQPQVEIQPQQMTYAQPEVQQKPENEPEFDRMLAQELDGQISLSLPEGDMVDKQITGQICIEDVLKEWEAKKQDSAARRREEAKKKSLNQTNDILAQLVGVIPGIVAPPKQEPEVPSVATPIVQSHDTAPISPITEEKPSYETVPAAEPITNHVSEREPVLTIEEEILQARAARQEEAQEDEPEEIAEEKEVKGRTSEIKMAFDAQEKQRALEVTGRIPNIILPSAPKKMEKVEEETDEIEEIEEINQPEELPTVEEIPEEPPIVEEMTAEPSVIEEVAEEIREEEPTPEPTSEPTPEETPEEEPEDEEEEKKKKKKGRPSYMTMEEGPKSKRDFDPEEQRIFAPFDGIEVVKAQVVEAMENISMDAGRGNILIMGSLESGRKGFSIDMIKALQIIDTRFSGKVAKITGQAMNKKDVKATITKLTGGALIIEEAGGLTKENMQIMCNTLKNDISTMIVVLEDTKSEMKHLLHDVSAMKEVFNAKIDIPEYSNDDLVAYAKGYAKELEYSIDEMGILALYTRIGERQTLDHIVSLEEVREIVDAAIKHVDKKNISHFTDILFAKRYDDDDYIILREKDFITK